ncbi:MAG: hypothetical protein OHK0029_09500 [Armatimonadaceae bacterium]
MGRAGQIMHVLPRMPAKGKEGRGIKAIRSKAKIGKQKTAPTEAGAVVGNSGELPKNLRT